MNNFNSHAPVASSASSFNKPVECGRILVIDDDFWIKSVVIEMLNQQGFQVEGADDGEAGWEALSAGNFDLLITDQDMPRLCGLDLLRRMRAAQLDLPAILISGCVPWDADDLGKLFTPGAIMEKPFSFPKLLKNVQNLLIEAKQPRETARVRQTIFDSDHLVAARYLGVGV